MRKISYALLLVFAFCLAAATSVPAGDLERATAVLDSLEHKLSWLEMRLGQERWLRLTGQGGDSLRYFRNLVQYTFGEEDIFKLLHGVQSDIAAGSDARRFAVLYPQVLKNYVDNQSRVQRVYSSLVDLHDGRKVPLEGFHTEESIVREIATLDRSRDRRESAYRALNSPDESVKDAVALLFRSRNQVARKLGYNDYFSLCASADSENGEDYRRLIDRLDSITAEPFRQVTGRLQTETSAPLEPWDWHSSVLSLAPEVDSYFPVDSQLQFVRQTMLGMGFNLDKLPIYFHLLEDTTGAGLAVTVYIDIPNDCRIVANLRSGFVGMSELLGAVGVAVHAAYISEREPVFARMSDSGWAATTRLVFERICYRPDWLTTVAHVPSGQTARVGEMLKAYDLYCTRLLLANMAFEYDAYHNPNRDLSETYWEAMENYTGLPRHVELAPWASDSRFITSPFLSRELVQARLAAAQILGYLNDEYGTVIDNTTIRSFLVQNLFRFGLRYDWRELLERGTGSPLTAAYMIR
ncbi:MAG: hypothetical protein KKA42_07375 [candidate division Zixibacteria bacterium]|nr:hypothetical protein [candidate division Zixibacteria bacterium]